MKKWKEMKKQLISGAIMLAVAVPLILIALSLGEDEVPTLAFEGVEMEMMSDGSVQMLMEVSIQNVEKSGALPAGAIFYLRYNNDYLTPSNWDTNKALTDKDAANLAFRYDPDLYQVKEGEIWVSKDPFDYNYLELNEQNKENTVNKVNTEDGWINLNLRISQNIKLNGNSKGLQSVMVAGEGNQGRNYIDKIGKIVLGTLSFRVEPENLDKLPEIRDYFGHIEKEPDPRGGPDKDKYLIWHRKLDAPGRLSGDWEILGYAEFKGTGLYSLARLDNSDYAQEESSKPDSSFVELWGYKPYATTHFTFDFPRIVISVKAAEAELTINAYQAYTKGNVGDLDIALQKYSPAVLVKYSDGTQENVIFPWGRTTSPWTSSVVTEWNMETNVITNANYDCTGGDYRIDKFYCYTEGDTTKVFPIPVWVHLTVKPITLLAVTANDLERSYPLNEKLVSLEGVQSLSDLDLPEEARLITDVPPGGATLTMQIPGWSHINVAGDDGVTPVVKPVYWPSTASGREIEDLWKDGAPKPGENEEQYLRWPVNRDLTDNSDGWNKKEQNDELMGKNRAGMYTFKMAKEFGGDPTYFTRTDIQKEYPWLTVPDNHVLDDVEAWPLEDATRRIVWNESEESGKKLVDRDLYEVTYVSTVTDTDTFAELLLPDLTLRVQKRDEENNGYTTLLKDSVFRVKLPDGTEMVIDSEDKDYWFNEDTDDSGWYKSASKDVDLSGTEERLVFDLTTNPGKTSVGAHKDQRERLLRYINLGGWFSVAVNEDPDTYDWSDFIPVYVPPRTNIHLENKVYNFIGENAALYSFVKVGNGIPTTVILPPGSYETVDALGNPEYDDIKDELTDKVVGSVRHVERYGVKTLYDGMLGSQFGELHTFTIEPQWDITDEGNAITRYGANTFMDNYYNSVVTHGAPYGAYGWVRNLGYRDERDNNALKLYTATIRTQQEPKEPQEEKIKLVYFGQPGGVTPYDTNPDISARRNVELVTFDTRVEGYIVRQEYTLTIVNVGDTDIYGLAIDMLTDSDGSAYTNDGGGGHFTILDPPASFLPAGEQTNFTLSYQYDLRSAGSELRYLDKLFITSDSKHTVGPDKKAEEDYLLDFDAEFKVTNDKIHHVWVEYTPADGSMGTAQVIVGLDDTNNMDTKAGSNAATRNTTVYVMATPIDEYEVIRSTATDSTGALVDLVPYTGPVTLADGSTVNVSETSQLRIWSLRMPDYDVTVKIDFYEPARSKLRLSELTAYADADENNLGGDPVLGYTGPQPGPTDKKYEYKVWQKSFTEKELDDANDKANYSKNDGKLPGDMVDPTEDELGRYLMSRGTAVKKGYSDAVDQYLVVIPYEANYAQVEATLRRIFYDADAGEENPNLPKRGIENDRIQVEMTLYPNDPVADVAANLDKQIYTSTDGDTNIPTVHTSRYFDSPKAGESNYVRVRINYRSNTEDATRYYFVEIHRAPQELDAKLNYGNSPYGMIMNATNITDKAAAKKAFVNNRYSFAGLADTLIPAKAKGKQIETLHYWTEAWVAPDAAYEPESGMGLGLYDSENNLDLDDYAFFAILGEDFLDPGLAKVVDSSGRPADLNKAVISLVAYTLDTDAATQTERFALPADPRDTGLSAADQAALAARTVTLSRQTPAGSLVEGWSDLKNTDEKYLRPGRYQLTYTLQDYDYKDYYDTDPAERDPNRDPTLKVTRDFVVLAPVGDVNSDLPAGKDNAGVHVSDATDEMLVKGRVTKPLGYMAANYAFDGAIFKLRTCDVNNDRNINNIDANTIRVGKVIERFYLPVDYK